MLSLVAFEDVLQNNEGINQEKGSQDIQHSRYTRCLRHPNTEESKGI